MQGLIHQKMNSRAVLGTITQSTPAGSDTGGSGSREHIAVTEPKALPEEPGGPSGSRSLRECMRTLGCRIHSKIPLRPGVWNGGQQLDEKSYFQPRGWALQHGARHSGPQTRGCLGH